MQQKFTHCYARRSLMALLWLLLPSIYLHAQKSAQPGRNVTITNGHISLRDVFNVIEKQTGVVLFFGELNTSQLVGVKFVATPIEEALAEMLPPLGLTYEYVKGNKDKIFIRSIVADRKKDTVMVMSVSGVVTDDKGVPLPGATVRLKGTAFGTATKENGSFMLNHAGERDIIQVSYTGFVTAEMPLAGRTNLKVQLKPGDNNLNETVVTAYGTLQRRQIAGAITVIKGEQIQTLPNRSFDKSLQGLVPGLVVTSGNGQPGSAPVNFLLRGIATGGSVAGGATVRNPLIVMDGIPVSQDPARPISELSDKSSPVSNPMAQLNPSDIESISVLKDAAAIALYGAKASNGVILITTKKGKAGKTIFNFRHQTDISSRLKQRVDLLNQREYLELLFEAYRNSKPGITDADILTDLQVTPSPDRPKFNTYLNEKGELSFYPPPNWGDKLFSNNAMTMANELSISGGNERSNFYINLEYTKQNGVVKNTGYDRKSFRVNYEIRPTNWLKLGFNTSQSYNVQNYNNEADFDGMQAASPLNPIYDSSGKFIYNYSWGQQGGEALLVPNPLAAAELNINKNTAYRSLSKFYGEVNFLNGFLLSSTFGVDFMLNELKEKVHPFLAINGTLAYGGRVREENFKTANIINTNTLQYVKKISGDFDVQLLVGQEVQIGTRKTSNVEVRGFANNPLLDQANGGQLYGAGSAAGRNTSLSYFGQLNTGFRNKYYLTSSARADGSSKFGRNERFGTYWSMGGSWIVSEEAVVKRYKNWLNYLKIRASFGPAGNSAAILDYIRYDELLMQQFLNGNSVIPNKYNNPGNPSIKWEETFTWDVGLELQTLKQRVGITIDIYSRKTKNLIAHNIPLPLATGFNTITSNIGDIKNAGIELAVTASILSKGEFTWNVNANWSRNTNKLVKAYYPLIMGEGGVVNQVGHEYNSFQLPIWAGVNPVNGRPMWIDSLGKKTDDYYAAKMEYVGKTQPDGFGSFTNTFSWRGIELSAMLYYQYGSKIFYNGAFLQNDGQSPYLNQSIAALKRWQKPGDVTPNPRRLLNSTNGTEYDMGTAASTRYLFDGDFIRLSNISLTYKLDKKHLSRFYLEGLKIFVQAHNVALWTTYSGDDPENVNAYGAGNFLYPQQRSFSVGLNATF
ncbi:SusC/RagA family TonB-linked outer membrane protein [Chitinophaga filiformis]|uniref:SusC/RagA family TonB-linked outer membrane protein n=1 Tax=Chitinophaga filiformis TaxID=104663 RepID=UPI001F354CCA|nr:SusC/RagA family TonB-linked outer membrane protein [Chitinophaga filiformis]MCF6402112.1 SusC/RagA family TonB-linked outer membrane protein [Chitinophaga filiformis]